jgi:hypothetical protein
VSDGLYCIDTSSLIDLKLYPRDLFGSLWAFLEEMIAAERLIAPNEVLRELEKGDDEIYKWAVTQKKAFINLTPELGIILSEVLADVPELAKTIALRPGPYADPLVVALARFRLSSGGSKCTVVTQERIGGTGSVKIPNLCSRYGISVVLLDMVRLEGLTFELKRP